MCVQASLLEAFLNWLVSTDMKLTSAQHSSLSFRFYISPPSLWVSFGCKETDNIDGLFKEEQLAFIYFQYLGQV